MVKISKISKMTIIHLENVGKELHTLSVGDALIFKDGRIEIVQGVDVKNKQLFTERKIKNILGDRMYFPFKQEYIRYENEKISLDSKGIIYFTTKSNIGSLTGVFSIKQ